MLRSRYSFLLASLIFLGPAVAATATEISIDQWSLGTVVDVRGVRDSDHSFVPMNPFSAEQFAQIDASTAHSLLSAHWDGAGNFDFLVTGDHVAAGHPQMLVTRSSGTIYITPSLNSLLSIDILYDYSLGSGMREARVKGAVADSEGLVYNAEVIRDTLSSPSTGQITVDSPPIPLNAGTQYALVYLLRLMSFSGSPSSLSQGEGFIRLELVPIPEPSTSAMILSAGLFTIRRGRATSPRAFFQTPD